MVQAVCRFFTNRIEKGLNRPLFPLIEFCQTIILGQRVVLLKDCPMTAVDRTSFFLFGWLRWRGTPLSRKTFL
jgi:hypothetical protein